MISHEDLYALTSEEAVNLIRDRIGHSMFDRLVLPESQTAQDYANPNVMLIEGKLATWEGEYSALSVQTSAGRVYLAEVLEETLRWKEIVTFSWHVASEPLTFAELEENLVKQAMGQVQTRFSHAYSDLTGYLWTNEEIKVGGHDVLADIQSMMSGDYEKGFYIALRVERSPK